MYFSRLLFLYIIPKSIYVHVLYDPRNLFDSSRTLCSGACIAEYEDDLGGWCPLVFVGQHNAEMTYVEFSTHSSGSQTFSREAALLDVLCGVTSSFRPLKVTHVNFYGTCKEYSKDHGNHWARLGPPSVASGVVYLRSPGSEHLIALH